MRAPKPTLLFLAHRIPYPPTKGEKLRAFNLLKGLSETYDIWLGAPLDDPDDWQHRDALDEWCIETHIADIRGRTRHRAAVEAVARGEPVSYSYFRERGMMNWVTKLTSDRTFDAVFVYSSGAAPYLKAIRRAPAATVMDFVDVDSEKWRVLGETAKGPMKHVYAREAKLLRAEERRLGAMADANLLVTDAECALYTELTGLPASTVGNGVDTEYWGAAKTIESPYSTERPRVIFTGVMDYEPNIEAVTWFAAEAMPKLRAMGRNVEFVIAGGRPTKGVQALGEAEDITITGRVEDMRGWLGHADLAVAPLLLARGVQNKVLEAMAAGTPVLTTTPALTGIDAVPGRDALVCETGEAFADSICSLLDDKQRRTSMAEAAQSFVRDGYGWGAKVSTLIDIIESARIAHKEVA
jgi:sugar transferase (PEP-CTERM/EpsH1 system associated)